jgi:hypothetical protein
MTSRQWNTAEDLAENNNHIVVECDKNLGGAILDRLVYNTKGVLEDLGDTNVYQRLSKKEAIDRNSILRYKINVFMSKWKGGINPAEYRFLHEAMDQHKGKLAKFRMSLKAH